MKRDLELVRKLLFFFDEKEDARMVKVPPIDGYDQQTIKYHLVMLYDGGYLRCEPIKSSTSDRVIDVWPFELTWQGHEFLDKVRNQYVWDEVLTNVKEKGLTSASIEVIKKLADVAIRKKLGLD